MKILITGGAGYIGSHTLRLFLENTNYEICVIDNLSKGSLEAINKLKQIRKFEFFNIDLSQNLEEIFSRNFDAVMHFAAFIEVFESIQNPLKYYQNNTVNLINLLNYCKKFGVKYFIFSSTAAVYGESGIVTENSQTSPINPYGFSKLMSEQIIKDFANSNSNFKYAILRYFNVAGASLDGLIGQSYENATHLIKVAVQTALKKRESMAIFGDDYDTFDGTCIRDYIHICDLAKAHLEALNFLQNQNSEIFNVGYGRGFSVKEVIEATKIISGVKFDTKIAPRRPGDSSVLVANSHKLKSLTNWKPEFDDLNLIIKTALNWELNLIKQNLF